MNHIMNPKREDLCAQVNKLRAEKAQAQKLQEQQSELTQLTYHDSVDSLMASIRAQCKADDENM